MLHDPWLDRWLPLIAERSRGEAILEIGCGSGADTATLAAAGHRVVAFDLSADSVARAQARVHLKPAFDEMPVTALIDAIEAALATPVQTAVKREDEQAFAMLNAANLMFCEDAARRVAAAVSADPRVARFDAVVSHGESLHPHDAVARVSGQGIDVGQ